MNQTGSLNLFHISLSQDLGKGARSLSASADRTLTKSRGSPFLNFTFLVDQTDINPMGLGHRQGGGIQYTIRGMPC